MHMKKYSPALAIFCSLFASAAYADSALSLSAGTTGLGLHWTTSYNDSVNFRLGFNAYSGSTTETTNDTTYDIDVKLRTFDALIDYYPTRGTFRLTGGLIYNGNEFEATAQPAGSGIYVFDGVVYDVASAGNVTGSSDFNRIAPYLGIGFGNAVAQNKGWGLTADLGVMFQGSPEISVRSNNCTALPEICNQLANDLAAESARLREDAKDYRFYPVARVGVTYKF